MAGFCIPKYATEMLQQKLKTGEVTPEKLARMTSAERRQVFSFMGEESARKTNAQFEAKLLLKNQQQGMMNWVEKILDNKPELKRDTLSKVERMSEILEPAEMKAFLNDLVAQRLGFEVTTKEAANLSEMARNVERTREALPAPTKRAMAEPGMTKEYLQWREKLPPKERNAIAIAETEAGLARALFNDYVASLKPQSKQITLKEFWELPTVEKPLVLLRESFDIAKSIVASIDNSLWGNQGIFTFLDPKTTGIWTKNFTKSFSDIKKGLKGEDASLAARAEIYSRPDAMNGLYDRQGIALGLKREEAYPSSLPERMGEVPVVGPVLVPFARLFKASSEAYHAGSIRLRADLADYYNSTLKKQGIDITDKATGEAIGNLVNAQSGRGSLGMGEATLQFWNRVMFSPRLFKGTLDVLTAGMLDKKVRSNPAVQRQAALKLMRITATYVAVMNLIEMMAPGTTELDPRKPHFGQVKIGDRGWVNVIGPMRPMVRALATTLPTYNSEIKGNDFMDKVGFWRQTQGGNWTGTALFPDKKMPYGAYTPMDVAEDFIAGKASPALGMIFNHWRGEFYGGGLPTPMGDLGQLTPITLKNLYTDVNDPKTESAYRNLVLNAIGFQVTEYDK